MSIFGKGEKDEKGQQPIFVPDPENANKGTEKGLALIEKSIERFGGARPAVADADNIIRAGNKSFTVATEKGLPVRVIETDGHEFIVVKRTDLRGGRAKEYGVADNRTSELDLAWDFDALERLADAGDVDLGDYFFADELFKVEASKEAIEEVAKVPTAIQLRPQREYVVVVCDEGDEGQWERLKTALNLGVVRRGGYSPGSEFEDLGTQRVVKASDLLAALGIPPALAAAGVPAEEPVKVKADARRDPK